jgi:hypothetical protein
MTVRENMSRLEFDLNETRERQSTSAQTNYANLDEATKDKL